MENVIIILIVAVLVGWALRYIHKEKKKGTKCIGCPSAGSCTKACSSAPAYNEGQPLKKVKFTKND